MSNVYAWPPDAVTVPAFIIGYPEDINPTTTFQRGSDELVLPCWYVAGQSVSNSSDTRHALSLALGAAPSMTEQVEGVFAAFATNVGKATIERVTISAVEYIAIKWDLDIVTSGAMNLETIMDSIAAAITAAGL